MPAPVEAVLALTVLASTVVVPLPRCKCRHRTDGLVANAGPPMVLPFWMVNVDLLKMPPPLAYAMLALTLLPSTVVVARPLRCKCRPQ